MKYLVVKGDVTRLKENVVPIHTYTGQPLNYEYYHERMILPPLQRVFTSLANLSDWLADTPVYYNPTVKHHFAVRLCLVCFRPSQDNYLCDGCIPCVGASINRINNERD